MASWSPSGADFRPRSAFWRRAAGFPSGKTLASATVKGDAVRQTVRFDGHSLRQVAPRGQCRLRFEVRPPAQLYGFVVTERSS